MHGTLTDSPVAYLFGDSYIICRLPKIPSYMWNLHLHTSGSPAAQFLP